MTRKPTASLLTRLLGEMTVIVAGILIAIWADSWVGKQADRRTETAILSRIEAEVEDQRRMLEFVLSNLERKEASLERVAEGLRRPASVADTSRFIADILRAANYGLGQPRPARAVYDEVVAAGRLGLIRDDELRTAIVANYSGQVELDRRMSSQLSAFQPTAYGLIPAQLMGGEAAGVDEADIMAAVLASPLRSEIIGEANRARFLRSIFKQLVASADALLVELDAAHEGG